MSLSHHWTKSIRSGDNGNCVEVRRGGPGVEVRDSKDADGPTLAFPADAWGAFLADTGRGDFDFDLG